MFRAGSESGDENGARVLWGGVGWVGAAEQESLVALGVLGEWPQIHGSLAMKNTRLAKVPMQRPHSKEALPEGLRLGSHLTGLEHIHREGACIYLHRTSTPRRARATNWTDRLHREWHVAHHPSSVLHAFLALATLDLHTVLRGGLHVWHAWVL